MRDRTVNLLVDLLVMAAVGVSSWYVLSEILGLWIAIAGTILVPLLTLWASRSIRR